jgi:hypothetical protein
MDALHLAHVTLLAGSLNQPGKFLSWSIFEISVANLIVIAVMVVIFGAALLIPFHGASKLTSAAGSANPDEAGGDLTVATAAEPGDEGMWTAAGADGRTADRRLGVRSMAAPLSRVLLRRRWIAGNFATAAWHAPDSVLLARQHQTWSSSTRRSHWW